MSGEDGLDSTSLGVPPDVALDTLALAIEGTATGTWMWEVAEDRITWSANLGPMHGLARGEAPVSYASWLEGIHADDRGRSAARGRSRLPPVGGRVLRQGHWR